MVWMIEANELKNSWPNKIAATIKTTITNNQSIKYIFFWCIYMNPLELILSKIPEKSQCPPPAGRRARKPDWLAGKKFPPPSPSPFFARSSLAEI